MAKIEANAQIYPVYPDLTYELASYFSAPRYTVFQEVTHAVISARRAANAVPVQHPSVVAAAQRRLLRSQPLVRLSTFARCFVENIELVA